MKRRGYLMFGLAFGAWLNIWPAMFHPLASFFFAYILLFIAMATAHLKENENAG